jgi:hypothetical protein
MLAHCHLTLSLLETYRIQELEATIRSKGIDPPIESSGVNDNDHQGDMPSMP